MSVEQIQEKFTKSCLTGKIDALFSSIEKKTRVYSDLVKGGMEGSLETAYPLCKNLLSKNQWKEFTDAFIANYPNTTPYLWRMPEGLRHFAREKHYADVFAIPCLYDLLDFEWLEVEVFRMEDRPTAPFHQEGDFLDDSLCLNPDLETAVYSYPVFNQLQGDLEKGIYPLLCFRDRERGSPHFVSLSPFFLYVVELIREKPMSGREALNCAAREFSLPVDPQLFEVGKKFFEMLFVKKALLGFLNQH